MIDQATYTKRFGTTVVISLPLRDEMVIQKHLLPGCIETIKKNRGDYLTQEAFDRHLALYVNALKFMETEENEKQ